MQDKFQLKELLTRLFHQFKKIGGENGIRTHERIAPLHAFQACALNHSATSPYKNYNPIVILIKIYYINEINVFNFSSWKH